MNSTIQIIRYEECESSLWKNGGGSTKQLLIWPKGADLSNFDFRFSIATISSNGPFSLFHGIDRQLCILEGEGVKLMISENGAKSSELILRPSQPAFCFSGETQIESQLLDKQIIDFNVMTKRSKYRAYIERLELNGSFSLEPSKTCHEDNVHRPNKPHNNEPQQWLLCLEPLNLVYQGKIIQLKHYDMVQYLRGQDLQVQPSEIPRLEAAAPEANCSNNGQSVIKQTKADNQHPLNHKQTQVLRIVIECIKGYKF
ncbi:HutD family protein [Shewanella decolorationis]|uniref:HutD family protein n=1 Tax=Shewanella decolorationis S12 TaxID=1353536 RepID=A0ABP2Z700_9GAMM|nr:HutD family protein [Shewanella decolorationis]ESE41269.1 hypothetical protein SHD_2179 [Shewanella decolorationis S12]GLR31688.1 hypothetical protein GCM10007922_12450 [Shewanella decolorationis]